MIRRASSTSPRVARQVDGKDQHLQSSREFKDYREEIAETLRVLIALAKDGQISSYVNSSPMAEGQEHFAVLDVESKASRRSAA
jgi:hypothetical protein